jgi:hypothetical protein
MQKFSRFTNIVGGPVFIPTAAIVGALPLAQSLLPTKERHRLDKITELKGSSEWPEEMDEETAAFITNAAPDSLNTMLLFWDDWEAAQAGVSIRETPEQAALPSMHQLTMFDKEDGTPSVHHGSPLFLNLNLANLIERAGDRTRISGPWDQIEVQEDPDSLISLIS